MNPHDIKPESKAYLLWFDLEGWRMGIRTSVDEFGDWTIWAENGDGERMRIGLGSFNVDHIKILKVLSKDEVTERVRRSLEPKEQGWSG